MSEYSSAPTLASRFAFNRSTRMNQLLTLAVIACASLLIAWQWRSWQTFDWKTFLSSTQGIDWGLVALAVALSLLTFPLRAWRWQVFLRPMQEATFGDVFSPTVIGFTGLALLGRPGELVRPYMIARRTGLTLSSQMGVWTVERIFDMGAFAVMAAVDFFLVSSLPDLGQFRMAAWITLGIIIATAAAAIVMCRWRESLSEWLHQRVGSAVPASCGLIRKLRSFSDGLNTVKDARSFAELTFSSIAIWLITAFCYVATLHAYPALRHLTFSSAMLLMGFSMIGGLVQLPAVGGGAQLATIVAMVNILHLPRELSVSAGILLWLVCFHAITPIGLAIARRAHISLQAASDEGQQEHVLEEVLSEPCCQENAVSG